MASSPCASSSIVVVVLLLVAAAPFAAGLIFTDPTRAFTITNMCNFSVWPAAYPPGRGVGGAVELKPAQAMGFNVTRSADIWGRTGCAADATGCATGDCGAAACGSLGRPPITIARFQSAGIGIGGVVFLDDAYGLWRDRGFNLPMEFACSDGEVLRCLDAGCRYGPHACRGPSYYNITFCPPP
ncbi:hypothetical protein ACP4OV_023284 [Aristida adscensionis]